MGNKTSIEWTDSTWSPIRVRVKVDAPAIVREKSYHSLEQIAVKMAGRVGQHCEHISPGCEHCYAETNNHRCLPANGTGLPYDRRSRDLVEPFVDMNVLMQPLKCGPMVERWTTRPNEPELCPIPKMQPRRIFVENQSDLFGEWVTDEMLNQVFAMMAMCPQHTFQILTKRPQRMLAYLSNSDRHRNISAIALGILDGGTPGKPTTELLHPGNWPLPNVWLGVSVEHQETVKRVWQLLKTPAAIRFVSCEPLVGSVDLDAIEALYEMWRHGATLGTYLDWVICGGESGPGARPMQLSWARSLRDQCIASKVPFFFKQWGQWAPTSDPAIATERGISLNDCMSYFSKKSDAGSLLDGREWKQFPEAQ